MKIIDEKGRLFGKLNLIDLLVIVLILAVVFVAVWKLGGSKAAEAVKSYLGGMNDTQKDYFSFQWQQAVKTAFALLNGTEDAAILQDAGDADFDLKAVDSKKVAEFNDAVIALLGDAGVTNEWKNHTDVEPFIYAAA